MATVSAAIAASSNAHSENSATPRYVAANHGTSRDSPQPSHAAPSDPLANQTVDSPPASRCKSASNPLPAPPSDNPPAPQKSTAAARALTRTSSVPAMLPPAPPNPAHPSPSDSDRRARQAAASA